MEIDAKARSAQMSVGEFACFHPFGQAASEGPAGIWRAQAGQQWHATIQEQSRAQGEGMRDEAPVEGIISWKGWTLQLKGRMDQFKEDEDERFVREIKSSMSKLPLSEDIVFTQYRHYVLQLLAYRELLARQDTAQDKPIRLELLFVEINSGLTQKLAISQNDETLIAAQLDLVVDYLEGQQERLSRLRSLKSKPAFAIPRPGQETIQGDLSNAFASTPIVCLEAPTGYGKTGVAWERALGQLANGTVDRIVYLTSKSTGQIEAKRQLISLLENKSGLAYAAIRNKKEHCINHSFRCLRSQCRYLENVFTANAASNTVIWSPVARRNIEVNALRKEGDTHGLCPYELMRARLDLTDVWIADFNYLFAPQSSGLFTQQNDFNPAKTLLIIDEAHNLPGRARASLSLEIDANEAGFALEEFKQAGATARIKNLMAQLIDLCAGLAPSDGLSLASEEECRLLVESIADAILQDGLAFDELSPDASDLLWRLIETGRNSKESALPYAAWAPASGKLCLSCLDAAPAIEAIVRRYAQCLLLSATLSPFDSFAARCGLDTQLPPPNLLQPPAPWRDKAYTVAIDARVDTRYKSRSKHHGAIANAIAKLTEQNAPSVSFFPSYAYAKAVAESMQANHPMLRVAMQKPGGSLSEQASFIEESLFLGDALFLILGSSYAEGIDLLGGKVQTAIVVSPALPQVNALREAEMELAQGGKGDAFEQAYLQPGIQKVNQALGRLVRAPGQTARILLMCQRFAAKSTQALLDTPYRDGFVIQNEEDFSDWLESPLQNRAK